MPCTSEAAMEPKTTACTISTGARPTRTAKQPRLACSSLCLSFILILALFLQTILWQGHHASFAALCTIPGISGTFPHCSTLESPEARPQLVMIDTKVFASILEEDTLDERRLILEIMKAQISTVDLLNLVGYSELGSKATVAAVLAELVEELRKAGRALQKFASKMRGLEDRLDRSIQKKNDPVF
jgi:hypothetical protein